MPLRFRKQVIAATPYESAGIADVDGDGIPDIICGAMWYRGPDFRRWHAVAPCRQIGEYHDDFSTIIMDVDGDGRPDVITGGWWGGSLRWRQNAGIPQGPWSDLVWKEHIIADGVGNIETTRAWDIDGDGVPEIIPNTPNHPLCAYKLRGPGVFSRHLLHPSGCGHGLGCGDIDGDGRLELITPRGILSPPADPLSGPWNMAPGPDFGHWDLSVPIIVADIDGDGQAELIVGHAHSRGLDWWKREKGIWRRHPIDPECGQYHDLHWADIDGDGICELVAGKRFRAHNGNDPGDDDEPGLYYFRWTGEGFSKQVIAHGPLGVGKGCGIHMELADLRGTGRLDVIAPGKDGLAVFWNEGSA
jgi:hypothetical protein